MTGRHRRAHLILLRGLAVLDCALASAYGGRAAALAAAGTPGELGLGGLGYALARGMANRDA